MFLNPIMLAFAAAAVVPLVLHLLSRSRQVTIRWGALMFLEEAPGRQSALRRLRTVIILGLRCGALLLLAIALARPVTGTNSVSAGASRRGAMVLVIDTSGSTGVGVMGVNGASGATRLDAIKEAASRVLAGLEPDDAVALYDPSETGVPAFTSDRARLLARIAALQTNGSTFDVAAGLNYSLRLLQTQTAGVKMLIVISDRQLTSYAGVTDEFAASFRRLAAEAGVARAVMLPVGDADRDNVSIRDLRVEGGTPVRGVPSQLVVTVRNDGQTPRAGQPVRITSNGVPEIVSTINLAPDSSTTLRVPITFPRAGRVFLSASVAPTGAPFDARLDTAVVVGQGTPVLVLTPTAQDSPVAFAIAPFGRTVPPTPPANADPRTLTQFDSASVTRLEISNFPLFSLDNYRVIVIPQLLRLSEAECLALRQFVFGGGGLIVGVEPQTDDATLRRLEDLLPAQVLQASEPDGPPVRVEGATPPHAVTAYARTAAEVLPNTSVWRTRHLAAKEDARVILAMPASGADDSTPLMLERHFGGGTVVLSACPLNGEWSDMTVSPGYVPLMQSLVRFAAGTEDQPEVVTAGTDATVKISLPESIDARSMSLELPDHSRVVPAVDRDGVKLVATWKPARIPGPYLFRYQTNARPATQQVFVRPDSRESDFTTSDETLQADARLLHADLISGESDITARIQRLRLGRELWPLLLACAAACLLAEQGIARGRKS